MNAQLLPSRVLQPTPPRPGLSLPVVPNARVRRISDAPLPDETNFSNLPRRDGLFSRHTNRDDAPHA